MVSILFLHRSSKLRARFGGRLRDTKTNNTKPELPQQSQWLYQMRRSSPSWSACESASSIAHLLEVLLSWKGEKGSQNRFMKILLIIYLFLSCHITDKLFLAVHRCACSTTEPTPQYCSCLCNF